LQITTVRRAIKTDCGVGFTAVGNNSFDILVMVGDFASNIINTVPCEMPL
jgi:hypothetical protein